MTARWLRQAGIGAGRRRDIVDRLGRAVALALLGALVLTGHLAGQARAAGAEITGVQVGFGGHYKLGRWTLVDITAQAGDTALDAAVELIVPDGEGVPSRIPVPQHLVAASGQSATVRAYVKFGSPDLKVRLVSEGAASVENEYASDSSTLAGVLSAEQDLVVSLGAVLSPDGLSGSTAGAAELREAVYVTLDPTRPLPDRWFGYDAVDVLAVSSREPAVVQALQGASLSAIDQWVHLGGRLLLLVGPEGAESLAAEAPLARFAPGKFAELVPLRQTAALEAYVSANESIEQDANQPGGWLRVPRLADVRGQIEIYEGNRPGDLPLIIRAPYGLGEVVFAAFHVDAPPFSGWKGQRSLVARLLARSKPLAKDREDALNQVNKLGFSDLAGQLHAALDQFAAVALVPFAAVAGLVLVYLLLLGPGDYFLLKKVLRRMELTWVTFPLLVLAFSAATYVLAYRLKGTEARLNQVDLVDVDVDSQWVRGTTWSTLYSPSTDRYDLSVRVEPSLLPLREPPAALLSWMALADAAVGGDRNVLGSAPFGQPYGFAPALDGLEGLPIAIWSTRSLVARWTSMASNPVSATLVDRGDHLLSGELELPDGFSAAEALLLYDRWVYSLGRSAGGRKFNLSRLDPQTVETYLRHITALDEKSARAPYDRGSLDLSRILEMLMFHDVVGGSDYTGLSHRMLGEVDLSGQIRLGRAVLVLQSATPATQLLSSGAPLAAHSGEQLTYYRFVLPVLRSEE